MTRPNTVNDLWAKLDRSGGPQPTARSLMTDDDKHAVAQAWWFGSEEIRTALDETGVELGSRDA